MSSATKTVGHTRGPWKVTGAGAGPIRVTAPAACGVLVAEAHDSRIAGRDCDHDTRTERVANARLIAAAPDLLEAAENAVYELTPAADPSQAAVRDMLSDAIAKAKGDTDG